MRRDVRTDFAIVGSGAAGATLAYHLARAGERVTVLERGRWVRPEDMTDDEREMLALLYKDGGTQMNGAANMFLLQGECVGGSTVLSNAVCFRLPDDVVRAFAHYGFDLPSDELAGSYDRVESVLNAQYLDERLYSPATLRLREGMTSVGLEPKRFKKSFHNCIGCGYCNMGCRHGRKYDAATTWVPMAVDRGAEILPQVEVRRILYTRGAVRGLLCRDVRDGSSFVVRAKRYVLSGGAINTPELLLRSGVLADRVGKRACFNVGTIMTAEYPEEVDGFDGDQMCAYHFNERFGIEQLQNPPLSTSLTLPGGYDRHHDDMGRYRRLAGAGVLIPSRSVGRVRITPLTRLLQPFFDRADVAFRLPEYDVESIRMGFKTLARVFLAAGAERVVPPARTYVEIRRESEVDETIDRAFRDHSSFLQLGSAHPQGGAPLGDHDRRDVVTPDYRVRGFGNLFVCDASLFPVSVRVNPMVGIMAVADHAVPHIGGFRPPERIEEGPAFEARRRTALLRG